MYVVGQTDTDNVHTWVTCTAGQPMCACGAYTGQPMCTSRAADVHMRDILHTQGSRCAHAGLGSRDVHTRDIYGASRCAHAGQPMCARRAYTGQPMCTRGRHTLGSR
eukprot:1277286-Pyramimonas_sp.AAC.1